MKPLIIPFPGNEEMAERLEPLLAAQRGGIEMRQFPDSETYLRIVDDPAGRDAILLCTLDRPNDKLLPLLFAAATLHELGALRVALVAPYLAYMRQDSRFHPGEAITSRHVAALLSDPVQLSCDGRSASAPLHIAFRHLFHPMRGRPCCARHSGMDSGQYTQSCDRWPRQ